MRPTFNFPSFGSVRPDERKLQDARTPAGPEKIPACGRDVRVSQTTRLAHARRRMDHAQSNICLDDAFFFLFFMRLLLQMDPRNQKITCIFRYIH